MAKVIDYSVASPNWPREDGAIVATNYGVSAAGTGVDSYAAITALLAAVKAKTIEARKIIFPYNGNGGYAISQGLDIDFPNVWLHFEDDLVGTWTTPQSAIFIHGTYSTTDESALLKNVRVTGNGRVKIDGSGVASSAGYTYDAGTYNASCVTFRWCDAPYLGQIRLTNGLQNCGRMMQCRHPVIEDCIGDNAVYDNGLVIELDPPIYSESDAKTWSFGHIRNCRAYDCLAGIGISLYGAPMRGRISNCDAWNCGSQSGPASSGVIGGAFSVEDDVTHPKTKYPRIVVENCRAEASANGFYVSSDYVTIDKDCLSINNNYTGGSDAAGMHGCGYSMSNVRHVRILGESRYNTKYGVRGVGYTTLYLDEVEIGGTHKANNISDISLQGVGACLIDAPLVYAAGTNTWAAVNVLNLTDYNVGAGSVVIRGAHVEGAGAEAISVTGVASAIISGCSGVANCAANDTAAVEVVGCTAALVSDVHMQSSSAHQQYAVSIDATTTAGTIRGCDGSGSVAPTVNNSAGRLVTEEPFVVGQCSVPVGPAPTGSVATNGALTIGTALPRIYSAGIWLYLPAGAAYSGSAAAFYWVVMSSTTLGTIYNNTYTPGTTSNLPPASPTAISAAGPGAYTGVTTELTAYSFALPPKVLGKAGSLASYQELSYNTAAGSKVFRQLLGATELVSTSRSTTGGHDSFMTRVTALGAHNAQSVFANSEASTSAATAQTTTAVDMTAATTFVYTVQAATATNVAIRDHVLLMAYPAN